MTAIDLSAIHAARRTRCVWITSKLIAFSFIALGGAAFAEEPITAVFKVRELSFQYDSPYQFYQCHELEQRVTNVLLAVGARDDIEVKARNCDLQMMQDDDDMFPDPAVRGTFGSNSRDRWDSTARLRNPGSERRQSAHIRIRAMMPVELTPQVLAEIDKDKSRRELVSRVTRNPAAAFNDPVVFAARRQDITLSQKTMRLQPEDCNLIEQMSRQVFRRLDMKVKRQSANCGGSRGEPSRIPPQLIVEALVPTGALMPMPDPEKQNKPAPSDDSEPETAEPVDQPTQ